MVVNCHHEACVSQSENPNQQKINKKKSFLKIGIFFLQKLGKKFL